MAILRRRERRTETQSDRQKVYGLLAKFDSPEALTAAARRVYEAGYRRFDVYSPYPIEDLGHVMGLRPSPIPWIVLAGGIIGGVSAFLMQTFATVVDYPQNIGGRPLFSWPTYIPITFETIVLFAALSGVVGLFVLTRLPQPYHPVFNSADFAEHGSVDAFYLDIQASDPKFEPQATRRFLEELHPSVVNEIEA